jgi:hypothetical protein
MSGRLDVKRALCGYAGARKGREGKGERGGGGGCIKRSGLLLVGILYCRGDSCSRFGLLVLFWYLRSLSSVFFMFDRVLEPNVDCSIVRCWVALQYHSLYVPYPVFCVVSVLVYHRPDRRYPFSSLRGLPSCRYSNQSQVLFDDDQVWVCGRVGIKEKARSAVPKTAAYKLIYAFTRER